MSIAAWEIVALVSGVIALGVAVYLYRYVMRQSNENEKMAEFSEAIQEGASAYLKLLYKALITLAVVLAAVLWVAYSSADAKAPGWQMALAFLTGSLCSAAAGYAGMYVATRANARVAWAARDGLNKAFPVAFFSGGVMGFSVVGVAILGMTIIYMLFDSATVVLGFSFGASLLALLAKAGGGIYTKTADIGADLVGKVEFGLDEDDPRNPAVIADNVGDNVGDVAGMGADIFDSFVASVVAVMLLGTEIFDGNPRYILLPLVLAAAGMLASLVGLFFVRAGEDNDPGKALNTGTIVTAILFAIIAIPAVFSLGLDNPWGIYLPALFGLIAGVVVGFTSDKYTDIDQSAVQNTANAANTGAAILILDGFSYGLLSLVPAILGIVVAMVASYFLADAFGVAGTYGVSIAAVGMLSISGMIVSADAYGPIVDNAKGCSEAGGESEETIAVCDRLDAAGNTAKAITKGFAIGAAALTVLALFSSYMQEVGLVGLDISKPQVMAGLFIGAIMPPVFSAMTILAVGRNAFKMVDEIRRQFNDIPGILKGEVKPDSAKCVDIATRGALRELVGPGLISVITPIIVGFVLGLEALGAFLGGSIVTGIIFAEFMANAGGLWDNAKKFIEDGAHGGKGSPAHTAAVIGDTVGDPFKDTAGPSLNTMITVMSLVATVFGPIIANVGSLF